MRREVYLGDGLYASFDGYQVILRTERKPSDHWVALDPEVWLGLRRFIDEEAWPAMGSSGQQTERVRAGRSETDR